VKVDVYLAASTALDLIRAIDIELSWYAINSQRFE